MGKTKCGKGSKIMAIADRKGLPSPFTSSHSSVFDCALPRKLANGLALRSGWETGILLACLKKPQDISHVAFRLLSSAFVYSCVFSSRAGAMTLEATVSEVSRV